MTASTAITGFAPVALMDLELARQLPALSHDRQHQRIRVLGRLYGEPIGVCELRLDQTALTPGQDVLTPDYLGELLWPVAYLSSLRRQARIASAHAGRASQGKCPE